MLLPIPSILNPSTRTASTLDIVTADRGFAWSSYREPQHATEDHTPPLLLTSHRRIAGDPQRPSYLDFANDDNEARSR